MAHAFQRMAAGLASLADHIYAEPPATPISERQKTHAQWVADKGDKTLRLEYPLDRNSIVFDVGGFEGQWASDIFSRYLCVIHVFEPVPDFAHQIQQRFAANERVKLHPYALGATSEQRDFRVDGDASSAYTVAGDHINISVLPLEQVIELEGINEVHLMKINIEGGEYEFLEHIIEVGLVARIQRFQIQFHDFVDDAANRMAAIQRQLNKTHRLTYQYPFVWEGWTRKDLDK